MKFLCVLCDQAMKLVEMAPPDRGALGIVYECPECAHRIAMLTNPLETQMIRSLGVEIRPGEAADGASKCPFAGMVAETMGGAPSPVAGAPAGSVRWSEAALGRLERIPEFVRPMAKIGIERYALDNGHAEVDEAVLDRAKGFFGM